MRAEDFFAQAETFPFADLPTLVGGGGLLVVAPHPDDESLGCGGLIAAACEHGVAVQLLVLSDGTGSHSGSRRYPAPRLKALREAETCAAAAELGLAIDAITFVGLPDRFLPIEGEGAALACEAIIASAQRCAASVVCVSWLHDPHCDHVAAAKLVSQVQASLGAQIFHYPVWGWTLPADTEVGICKGGARFDVMPHLGKKAAAVSAHRSQITDLIDDDPNGFRLTDQMLSNFRKPYEVFIDAGPQH